MLGSHSSGWPQAILLKTCGVPPKVPAQACFSSSLLRCTVLPQQPEAGGLASWTHIPVSRSAQAIAWSLLSSCWAER